MKTIKRTVLLTLIASVSLLFSCAKDGKDGLPGPAGSAGPAGNANVKSQTFTSNWVHIGTQGQSGDGFLSTHSSSIITSDIVNNGAVLAYYFNSTLNAWITLPFSEPFSSWTSHWRYNYKNNLINFIKEDSDFFTSNPGNITFKVVAIASSARLANPNVDYTNYEEVKATFNLKD